MNIEMSLRSLLLIPFLLTACTAEEAPDSGSGQPAAGSGFLDDPSGGDPLQAAIDGGGSAQANAPLIPATTQYAPKREPEFHFETEAIPDSELGDFYVEMSVAVSGEDKGTMSFVFWPEKAPKTVRNFLRYVDEGFYDGLAIHRILRDFMVQGGSITNDGSGKGPHGTIPGEFSDEPQYDHRYGVLSMARSGDPNSAGSQFFIICGESMSTVGLNGGYASFGKMVNGVAALEAVANVPVGFDPVNPREKSHPQQRVLITSAVVKRGTPPQTEEVVQPKVDLGDAPERIIIQHILVSMAGVQGTGATRTQEEAAALAQQIVDRARGGEDFGALVQELTDDTASKTTDPPGSYRMLNSGVFDYESVRASMAIQKEAEGIRNEIMAKITAKEITPEEAQAAFMAEVESRGLIARLQAVQWMSREEMVPGFGEVGFNLAVGEIGLLEYDAVKSPFGWHIIKRIQ